MPPGRPPSSLLLGLLVLLGTALPAQSTSDEQPPATRAGTGVIRGRVVRAGSGEPLRRVQVRVEEWGTADLSGPAATMTDAEGRYELSQLPAGRYYLKASRGGYVEVAYGQRRPFERGRPLDLADGAVLERIDFALPPGAVVTGRVVDEAGEAVAQAQVSLLRRRYVEGARRLVGEHGDATDDRGEFRIFGVPPGDYVIAARLDTMEMGSRDRLRYVPTYYPGTPHASEAQRLGVGIGQAVAGITIPIGRAATAAMHGVVRSSGQAPPGPFTMVNARRIDDPDGQHQHAMGVAAPNGSFTIAGLLPGTYVVEARSIRGTELASAEVVIDGADVAGVTLTLSGGATARGRIRFDTGAPPPGFTPSQAFVHVTQADEYTASMSAAEPPGTRDDWTFELQGLRGRGFVRAGTVSEWQLKRVLLAGADVTDTPLDFSADTTASRSS